LKQNIPLDYFKLFLQVIDDVRRNDIANDIHNGRMDDYNPVDSRGSLKELHATLFLLKKLVEEEQEEHLGS